MDLLPLIVLFVSFLLLMGIGLPIGFAMGLSTLATLAMMVAFDQALFVMAQEMGMDPVHFGVMMALNLCIGICTPPVGAALFVGASIAGVPVWSVLRPIIPFYLAFATGLVIVTLVPELSLAFGFYPRLGFIHVDLGPARQWGERFPVCATAFASETPPAREVLADSRTMKGGGAAGLATLGAAGVKVAQNVLTETQSAILPLVPYLDTLRWVFIAVALGGIAVTIYARLDDWRRRRR